MKQKNTYYLIQIPYLLDNDFLDAICYSEEFLPQLQEFAICFWEMTPRSSSSESS
ncbi:MAG: hypothetical protein LBV19_10665 [Streptococcaceae bacterium]|jgi:hypothetical protein|nr:hypothetical protein [Streptococcaceae bacterium]